MNRRAWLVSLLAAAVAVGSSGLPSPRRRSIPTDITEAGFGRRLSLTDHLGKPRTLEDFKGKVIVVFFGYTQCPDVCPSTLGALKMVREKLEPHAARLPGACC